jgi:2-hydroxy-4-carboxymuconate semialdehyde hemiacetal dehydrogenase
MNALGQPRSWTDHLLWLHAPHTVDLFAYQCRSPIVKANAVQGLIHPTLGIDMDMSVQQKAENGAICTISLSFSNDGPLGTFFRYIGDSATYVARYDDLYTSKDEKIDARRVPKPSWSKKLSSGPTIPRGPFGQPPLVLL